MSTPSPGNPLQRLPLPLLFLVIFVIWSGSRLVFAHGTLDPLRIGIDVVGGLVIAAILTAGIGARRRRLGGTDASLLFARAVRTGELPAGTDTAHWPEELDRTERRLRRTVWFVRIGGLLPFGLGVWGLTDPDARLLGAVLAVGMVAGWIATEVSLRRTTARIARLRDQLGRTTASVD